MKGTERGMDWNGWERRGMKGNEGGIALERRGMKGNEGGMHWNEGEQRRKKGNEGGMNWNEGE